MAESIIRAIDSASIHRITSGQVVIDLQTAVKELVENSLDAGATSIEVRFKDYGLKSIEVVDNGHGVAPEDYDSMALKHHTSKLATFDDLGTVLTFGFRGEALSSLCALSSSVVATTATAEQAPMGTILDFDRSGKVKNKPGKVARQRGTSVMITGLFAPLPVRRKELEKNVKREYGKALNLLQAYALVPCANENRGVRLTVSNHPTKGARSIQIRTDGSPSSRTSVSSLWGPKSLDNIVDLDLSLDVEAERSSVLKKRGVLQERTTVVKVKGLISKFSSGCGRTSTDRQFFYVNGRPCNTSKVQKAFNEIYRSFNTNQAPFVIADFQLPTNACDINVSPDKRTIFIHSENNLIQALKTSLEETFSQFRSTFSINGASSKSKDKASLRRLGSDRGLSPVSDCGKSHGASNSEDEDPGDFQGVEGRGGPSNNCGELTQNKSCHHGEPRDKKSHRESSAFGTSRRSGPPPPSSNAESQRNTKETYPSEARDPDYEDIEMATYEQDGIAVGVPTPIVSQSNEVDNEVPSQLQGNLEVRSDANPASQHRAPLFIASPSPARASQPPAPQTFSASSIGDRSSSPCSSIMDGPEERPQKRQRISSPTPTLSTTESRPVQMISGTAGAAWDLKVQPGRGAKTFEVPEAKKSKMGDSASARDKLRSQLSGFVATGSQMKPIEIDEEEVDDGQDELDTKSAEGLESQECQGQSEQQTGIDEFTDEVATYSTTKTVGNKTPDVRHKIFEMTDDAAEDVDIVPGPVSQEHDTNGVEGLPREEIVRTSTTDLTLRLDFERLSSMWSCLRPGYHLEASPLSTPTPSGRLNPSASIANADDAEAAEQELARVIHKEDFSSMRILGQFNLGFIIARRTKLAEDGKHGVDDLFIVDQHAADEKYNFETLQQTTKIDSQKLFQPQPLELTAADELMAIENLDVLRANGFEVMINKDARTGQRERLKLVAQPVSKGTTFDMRDLEELLHLMQDQPNGHMVRCSKARAMFAMRACRKSVMVGKALTTSQMTSVIRHMGTMDQPWNCPHGRPTMRHLINLNQMNLYDRPDRNIKWNKFAV